MSKSKEIPNCQSADEALAVAKKAFSKNPEYVSVFFDGRDKLETAYIHQICGEPYRTPPSDWTIIVDGDGQEPLAYINREIYEELKKLGVLDVNSYAGYHRRRIYDFKKEKVMRKSRVCK